MALSPISPRDRLQRLVDLGRKAMRHWWLVAAFAVGGGAISLVFALTRPRVYQAEASVEYQERMNSSLLSNREETVQRNIGDRYRELLRARPQLQQILDDPKLNPYPQIKDPQVAIEKLRQAVRFESKGGVTFRITYTDSDPDRARDITERLTKILQDKDESLRNEQAFKTEQFAVKQRDEATTDLAEREKKLAEFLNAHPEFAQDPNQGGGEGGAIRAVHATKVSTENTRLGVLERQRIRLQARLDAPANAPPIRMPAPPSAEKQAAESSVAEAKREQQTAQRALEEAAAKFTDQHPAVINARARLDEATRKLRHAEAAVPPDIETPIAPASPADRTKIQRQLAEIEGQISDEQKRANKGADAAADAKTSWVVKLETEYAKLRREFNDARESVEALTQAARRAHDDLEQKKAEQGRLSVINPAERPSRPSGPGKTIFLLAGMALFLTLGLTLAVGYAVLDDRLYGRYDIEQLGIAVLAIIPPPKKKQKEAVT